MYDRTIFETPEVIAQRALELLLPNVYNITGIIDNLEYEKYEKGKNTFWIEVILSHKEANYNLDEFTQKILFPAMLSLIKTLKELEKEHVSVIPNLPEDRIAAYAMMDNLVLTIEKGFSLKHLQRYFKIEICLLEKDQLK